MQRLFPECMSALFAFGLVVFFGSQSSFSEPSPASRPSDLSSPGFSMDLNAGLDIPQNEIPVLQESALRGDGKAALRLAQFYGYKGDSVADRYWLTISAEDGNAVGMNNLGVHLFQGFGKKWEKTDRKDSIRARFWLERAVQEGSPVARAWLKDMGDEGL